MDILAIFQDSPKARHIEPGTFVFCQGDPAGEMYVLLGGSVEIRRDGKVVETLEPGSIFGEMGIVDDSPRSAEAYAAARATVDPIDAEWFKHLIRKSPSFGLHVMSVMAQRLRRLMQQGQGG